MSPDAFLPTYIAHGLMASPAVLATALRPDALLVSPALARATVQAAGTIAGHLADGAVPATLVQLAEEVTRTPRTGPPSNLDRAWTPTASRRRPHSGSWAIST